MLHWYYTLPMVITLVIMIWSVSPPWTSQAKQRNYQNLTMWTEIHLVDSKFVATDSMRKESSIFQQSEIKSHRILMLPGCTGNLEDSWLLIDKDEKSEDTATVTMLSVLSCTVMLFLSCSNHYELQEQFSRTLKGLYDKHKSRNWSPTNAVSNILASRGNISLGIPVGRSEEFGIRLHCRSDRSGFRRNKTKQNRYF